MVRFTKKINLQSISIICLDKNVQLEYLKIFEYFCSVYADKTGHKAWYTAN